MSSFVGWYMIVGSVFPVWYLKLPYLFAQNQPNKSVAQHPYRIQYFSASLDHPINVYKVFLTQDVIRPTVWKLAVARSEALFLLVWKGVIPDTPNACLISKHSDINSWGHCWGAPNMSFWLRLAIPNWAVTRTPCCIPWNPGWFMMGFLFHNFLQWHFVTPNKTQTTKDHYSFFTA